MVIWWAVFIGINASSVAILKRVVPSERYRTYEAKTRKSSRLMIVIFLIPFTATLQCFLDGSADIPLSGRLSGAAWMIVGYFLEIWAFRSNPYFSPIIEKPPRIIRTGAYRLCRHPHYIGCIIATFGQLLLLGQSWAIIPAALYIGILLNRIRVENKLLYS